MNEKNGKTYWFDLPVRDMLDAMSFYEGLFGWTFLKLSDPVLPAYYVIQKGDTMIGGLRLSSGDNVKKAESDAPLLYFTVEELAPAQGTGRKTPPPGERKSIVS